MNRIICGDCLKVMPTLPAAKMVFADPPDNLGMEYKGFEDRWPDCESYAIWLGRVVAEGTIHSQIFWLSYNYIYQPFVVPSTSMTAENIGRNWRQFIWRFTFGQHNPHDCKNGYRPIIRTMLPNAKLYPDAIREPSARQTKYKDKRANPAGRVPDDVWEFSRVCGTFKEKRQWHPNQHPEALIERIVKFSCKKGDLVIDMFGGTFTVNRVCKRLGIDCIGIEISEFYCEKAKSELDLQ